MILRPSLGTRKRAAAASSTSDRIRLAALRVFTTFAVTISAVVPIGATPVLATTPCPAGAIEWATGDGTWGDGANWTGGSVPTSGSDACIPAGVTVTMDASGSVNRLISHGTLDIDSVITLNLAGPSQTNGLILEGNLEGTGSLLVNGAASWDKGTIEVDIEIASGATLNITGVGSPKPKNILAMLTNNGMVDQTGTNLSTSGAGVLGTIMNNGTWYFSTTGDGFASIRGSGSGSNAGMFINSSTGLVERRTGATEVELTANVNVENYGTLNAATGILKITSFRAIGNGAVMSADSGGRLRMEASASGAIGTAVTGTSTISGAGTVEWFKGTFGNAAYNFADGAVVNAVSGFELSGAEIAGTGVLRVTGTATWVKGLISGNFEVTPSGTLTILEHPDPNQVGTKAVTGTLTNNGTVIQPVANVYGSSSGAAGIITNNALWQFTNTLNRTTMIRGESTANPGRFVNNGTLESSATAILTGTHNTINLENSGTVAARSGQFWIGAAPTHYSGSVFSGGTWEARNGSGIYLPANFTENDATLTLTGPGSSIGFQPSAPNIFDTNSGTLRLAEGADYATAGNLTNTGSIELANAANAGDRSTLTVNGDLTLDAAGTLDIQIGGASPTGLHGDVVVTGNTELGGTLKATLLNGYMPVPTDTYQIMAYPTTSGAFGTYEIGYFLEADIMPTAAWLNGINPIPIADADGPYQVEEGGNVTLDGADSFDPGGAIASWSWADASWFSGGANGPTPTFGNTADDGTFTVDLTVCDADGQCATDSSTVVITNVAPSLTDSLGGTLTLNEGTAIPNIELATFTDPGADTHVATVDWGDGSPATSIDPATSPIFGSHLYTASGSYDLTIDVTDDDLGTDSVTIPVQVANVAPTITPATPSLAEGDAATNVLLGTITDPGVEIFTATMDWGDGPAQPAAVDQSTRQVTGTHAYADNGSYTGQLCVMDDDDQTCDTVTVTVVNVAPTMDVTEDVISATVGETITINGTYSDPGSADMHTATVNWMDGSSNTVAPVSDNAFSFQHTYTADGLYTVDVCIADDDSGSRCDEVTVDVDPIPNVAPIVDAGGDYSTVEGSAVAIAGTATDPDGNLDFTRWTSGPGGSFGNPDLLATTFLAPQDGTYTITLTGTDTSGVDSTDQAQVVVSNMHPSIIARSIDDNVGEGSVVTLTGGYSDPGILDLHTARVDWFDGDGFVAAIVDQDANTLTATNIYPNEGRHEVNLCVSDELDTACNATVITIVNVAPSIDSFTVDSGIPEGSSAILAATFSDPGVLDSHTATIDWGEGAGQQAVLPSGNTISGSNPYEQDGSYTVELCVTDDDLDTTCDTVTITVVNVNPIVTAIADETINEGETFGPSLVATFTDPGADTWTATIDWGDGEAPVAATLAGPTITGSNTFEQDGSFTVLIEVSDDDGSGTDSFTIWVNNVAPTIDSFAVDTGLPEGSTASLTATFSDPGADSHTATIDWGEGDGAVPATVIGTTVTGSNVYEQDGTYTVTVCVADDDDATCSLSSVAISNVAPQFDSLIVDTGLPEGSTAALTATFTDPGTDSWTATIDWGEGDGAVPATVTGTTVTGSNLYEQDGTYTVTVCVADDDDETCSLSSVAISNVVPIVDAGPDVTADVGDSVDVSATFTDPGDDSWTATLDWGDGSPMETLNVDPLTMTVTGQHVYASGGTFTVTVCVFDGDDSGCDGLDADISAITNTPPTADAGGPYAGDEGAAIQLDGSGSTDSEGTIATYRWTSSGGAFDDPNSATPIFTGPDDGTYTVTLEVTDDGGLTAAATTGVTVANVAPTVNAGGPIAAAKAGGGPSSLSATFTDPGTDTHTAVIEWGDGSPNTVFDPATSPISASHQYANPGTYMVRITVTDDEGGTGSDTIELKVDSELGAPVADAGGPYRGREGSRIRLSGSRSSDDDGKIVSYQWSANGGYFNNPSKKRPKFTAPDNGTYTVTLTVTDNDGLTDTSTATVTVRNVKPKVDAGRNATIRSGERYRLRATWTDRGTADTHSAIIDWGDGHVTRLESATSPLSLSHRYAKPGRYKVKVTITDDDGGSDSDKAKVTVNKAKADRRDRIRDFLDRLRDWLRRLRDRYRR